MFAESDRKGVPVCVSFLLPEHHCDLLADTLALWTSVTLVCVRMLVQVVLEMGFSKGWTSDDCWLLFQEFFGKEFTLFPVCATRMSCLLTRHLS